MPIFLDDVHPPLAEHPIRRRATPWRLWGTPAPAMVSPPSSPSSPADAAVARVAERCRTCMYSRIGEEAVRECHRGTPHVVTVEHGSAYAAVWPRVEDFDWCGEYRAR